MKILKLILPLLLFTSFSTPKKENKINEYKEEYKEVSISVVTEEENEDIFLIEKQTEKEEYKEAAYIWNYLKDLDYNNYIISGILGNMMVECGGNTLNLIPTMYSKNNQNYGLCQWSKKYYPGVIGASLEEQCNYLRDNIEYEFNTFGKCYRRGFDHASFLLLEDEQEAALAFAKCYERCSKASYNKRKKCAKIALEYFSGLKEN